MRFTCAFSTYTFLAKSRHDHDLSAKHAFGINENLDVCFVVILDYPIVISINQSILIQQFSLQFLAAESSIALDIYDQVTNISFLVLKYRYNAPSLYV